MTGLRRTHGRQAELGRLATTELTPWDEMPDGEPAQAGGESPGDRGEGGAFARGNSLAAKGGRARAGRTRLASQLGLSSLDADPRFAPYRRSAEPFRRAQCASLAVSVGAGVCGPGPASMVASAALALAASRFLYDTAAGDPKVMATAARLADSSRASLRDAHALCALEGEARAKAKARGMTHAEWLASIASYRPPTITEGES